MIQIEKMPKGNAVVAHNAIEGTTTSGEISVKGYNAAFVSVDITGTGTWKIDLQGKLSASGTYMDLYDNNDNQLTTGNLTADRIKLFVAIPDYIKVVATEVVDGATCTVRVQPINI